MSVAAALAARVTALTADDDAAPEAASDDSPNRAELPVSQEGNASSEVASDAEVAASATDTPDQIAAKERAARVALFEEKLRHAREKRQGQKLAEKAAADRRAAKAEREAAAAERAKYDGLKTGSFKDTLTALGRDPRKTFEELQREAIEASTPEAQARREKEEAQRDREALKRELEDKLSPLQQELEQLRAERAEWAARSHQTNLVSSFRRAVADPAFTDLRIEYPEEALLDHAQHYDKNPDQFRAAASRFGVRLTAPEKGFTMHELLQVLAAAQAEHNAGVQARRSAQSPVEPSAAPPTVNGTAPRRNAGTAIGNDLASQRASTGPAVSGLSPKERLQQRVRDQLRRG